MLGLSKKKSDHKPGTSKKRIKIDEAKAKMFAFVAAAAAVVAACIVLMNYIWGVRSFNNRVIDELKSTNETAQQSASSAEELSNEFKALESSDVNSKTILDALPNVLDFPALATSVEKLVAEDKLVLESFSAEDTSDSAEISSINPEPIEIPFTVVVNGEYSDIKSFITNSEKVIRPLQITNIEYKGTERAMSATIQFLTYYQPSTSIDTETKEVR